MNQSTNTPMPKNTESRFPTFDEARARYLADQILGLMGYGSESSELLIELIHGIMHECKTPEHDDDHHGGFWAKEKLTSLPCTMTVTFKTLLRGLTMNQSTDALLNELEALRQKQLEIVDDLSEIQYSSLQSAADLMRKQAEETEKLIVDLEQLKVKEEEKS